MLLIGAVASSLEHVNLGHIILEYAFLSVLLKHVIVILQFAVLAWWVHAVTMR